MYICIFVTKHKRFKVLIISVVLLVATKNVNTRKKMAGKGGGEGKTLWLDINFGGETSPAPISVNMHECLKLLYMFKIRFVTYIP